MDKNKVCIVVETERHISDDQSTYQGAIVDDYNRSTRLATLFVDVSEIDADYDVEHHSYLDDAWGLVMRVNEYTLNIRYCKWYGHHILNDDEVCSRLEEYR